MDSLGKYLKAERELRRLTLEEVTNVTKIRKSFLEAIEKDSYEFLPPGVYLKGYLIAYARYLGLDPNEVTQRYQDYVKSLTPSEPEEVQKWIPPPKKRFRRWIFLIPIPVIFLMYYISYKTQDPFSPPIFEGKIPKTISFSAASPPWPVPIADHEVQKEDSQLKEEGTKEVVVPSESPPFEVLESNIGTGIGKERGLLVLTGKCSELICNNQKAYFFTKIKAQRTGKISHAWLWKGKEFQRVEMEVNPPTWSVYSYMTLSPQRAGDWKIEVRYGDNILNTLSFRVIESDSNSNQEKVSGRMPISITTVGLPQAPKISQF